MQLKTNFVLRLLPILLVALTISCRGQGVAQVSKFSDQSQILPATITVINWNAQKGKNPQFASDLKLLLMQEKPDIVFLQEAMADFFKPKQMGNYFAEGWRYPCPAERQSVF